MMRQILCNSIVKLTCLFCPLFVVSQDYTWVKGSNQTSQLGVYGTLNVPSPNNNPGTRHSSMGWKDSAGNLWLFGGLGLDGSSIMYFLNDLWKYDVLSNQWTWVGGSNIAMQPGIYGTKGVSSPANQPGARMGASTWTDLSGNFWMFGGFGIATTTNNIGYLNDLWKYNVTTNEWTWENGTSNINVNGVYGTQGQLSSSNDPASRAAASSWVDLSGNLWMFGGANSQGFNDLWKYDMATSQWVWMKGSNLTNQNGVYNTIGVASLNSTPGARQLASSGKDAFGSFYLFGGSGSNGSLNDLWKYDVQNNQWTWLSGSNLANQNGNYGVIGVLSPNNQPGARFGSNIWMEDLDNMYLFGGAGMASGQNGNLNDLWRYSISSNSWVWLKGNNNTFQTGVYGTQGISSPLNNPGSRQRGLSWIDNSKNLWLFGGSGFSAINNNNLTGPLNDLWKISCKANPTVLVVSNQSPICAGENTTLTASGASVYWWYPAVSNATSIITSPTTTTSYTLTGYAVNGCSSSSSITQLVNLCTGLNAANNLQQQFLVYPNPNDGVINFRQPLEDAAKIIFHNTVGQAVLNIDITNTNIIKVDLPNGLYLYDVFSNDKKIYSGKLIISK